MTKHKNRLKRIEEQLIVHNAPSRIVIGWGDDDMSEVAPDMLIITWDDGQKQEKEGKIQDNAYGGRPEMH